MHHLPIYARTCLDHGEVNSGLAVRPPNAGIGVASIRSHMTFSAMQKTAEVHKRRAPYLRRMVAAVKMWGDFS